ncbi:MAG: DUF423 domain-containing protein [Acidobacteria bacterium]|nr:MAG: DUF423 domain-containing protein [Acidobacteriota bacterium]
MTPQGWIAAGALLCALSIAAGAFGAHGLTSRLDPRGLELWETAARYAMYGGLALLAIGLTALDGPRRGLDLAGSLLLAGSVVFSGTVAALALGAPRWLGAVTPAGGLAMIVALVLFAAAVLRG